MFWLCSQWGGRERKRESETHIPEAIEKRRSFAGHLLEIISFTIDFAFFVITCGNQWFLTFHTDQTSFVPTCAHHTEKKLLIDRQRTTCTNSCCHGIGDAHGWFVHSRPKQRENDGDEGLISRLPVEGRRSDWLIEKVCQLVTTLVIRFHRSDFSSRLGPFCFLS